MTTYLNINNINSKILILCGCVIFTENNPFGNVEYRKLALLRQPLSGTVGIFQDPSSQNLSFLADPSIDEIAALSGKVTIVFDENNNICAIDQVSLYIALIHESLLMLH
jgi:exosome complex RNA-binding protein Rrp42 (RNase PH superfamily)